MTSRVFLVVVACAAVIGAPGSVSPAQAKSNFTPVTDAVLQNPDPADWLSWRRTLAQLLERNQFQGRVWLHDELSLAELTTTDVLEHHAVLASQLSE